MRSLLCCAAALGFGLAACGDDDDGDEPGPSADAGAPDAQVDASDDAATGDPLLVETSAGPVRGAQGADGVRAFLGIPYAAPPVGARRWQPPAPPEPWREPRDATARGPACPQTELIGTDILEGSSEDCLTANVWTPADADGTLPVLVWIHGGGFTQGSGGEELYDGAALVGAQHAVLVTLNYRLGPLGFLALPGLGDGTGAFGMLDQRAALAWVQDNAAAFGGDPANVTVLGESAGSISICLHLVSPDSEGLFQRAVMESGSCAIPFTTLAQAEATGARLVAAVGCDAGPDPLGCLRAVDANTLVTALAVSEATSFLESFLWFPPVDGVFLSGQPAELLEQGAFTHVPLLLGTNTEEGTLLVRLGFPDLEEAGYADALRANVGDSADAVVAHYPVEAYPSVQDALAAVLTDGVFTCPTRRVASTFEAAGQDVFLYSFGYGIEMPFLSGLGAFHGSEIPFVFGNGAYGMELSAEELALSEVMQGYWARFAARSDPNAAGETEWPLWSPPDPAHIVLDLPLPVTTGTSYRAEACDFWDTVTLSR